MTDSKSGDESRDSASLQDESDAGRNDPPDRSGTGGGAGPAWLALLVALAAIAAVGWLYWEREFDRTDDTLTGLQVGFGAELERAAEQRADLGRTLGEISDRMDSLEAEPDGPAASDLEARIDRLAGELDGLSDETIQLAERTDRRLGRIEGRVEDALAELEDAGGRLGRVDRDLARLIGLLEARALIATGMERLELAEDVSGARTAWRRAIARVERLDDPRAGPVRRSLVRELEALEAWSPPDRAGRMAGFLQLADSVPDWRPRSDAPDTRAGNGEEPESWRDRLRQTLGRLVRVRPRDGAAPAAGEVDAARHRLRQSFLAAGLASARDDQAMVKALAAGIRADMERYFDAEDVTVVRAREQVADLLDPPETESLPRLGEGLSELDRLIEGRP